MFLQNLERVGSEQPSPVDWMHHLSQGEDVERKERASSIRKAESAAANLQADHNGVKIWSGPSADRVKPSLRVHAQPDMSLMERDFTTAGTPSKLGCPFASGAGRGSPLATPRSSTSRMSLRGRRSARPSFTDPIRAEICGNDPAPASESIEGSAAVCPIRFLDQHAPEEVAKYFENHKHEIPRSHEVCIKRFQSNTESIRQLDRKYGNLVSMIQGLGQKHQEFLPPEPEDDQEEPKSEPEAKTEAKVETWAKAVTASLGDATPEEAESLQNGLDEARTAHFDRPLKEIRVGESPSRPWGISIPAKYTDAESSSSVGSAPTASPPLPLETGRPVTETPRVPPRCPFDHSALGKTSGIKEGEKEGAGARVFERQRDAQIPQAPSLEPASARETRQYKPEAEPTPAKMVPQMVFNGPVFLGYPPDQIVSLLQSSNLGGMTQ